MADLDWSRCTHPDRSYPVLDSLSTKSAHRPIATERRARNRHRPRAGAVSGGRSDALYWVRVVYTDNLQLNEDARQVLIQAGSDFFKQALAAVDKHYPDFHALANEVKTSTGTKGKHLFQPLRVALTGELHGPEMTSLLPLLPIDRVKNRLQAWVSDAS